MLQLTGLDAAFLAMETPNVFGHVGSVCVLDPSTSPAPFTLDRLTRVIESRLHLIPPFRRRQVNRRRLADKAGAQSFIRARMRDADRPSRTRITNEVQIDAIAAPIAPSVGSSKASAMP